MKIDYFQALKKVNGSLGAWILHGQEPLLEQNLLDQFRTYWQSNDVERQRYDLQSVSDWKTIFQALNSLSLFSQSLAIEVHGNIKPDAQHLKLLKQFIQTNELNTLLIVMPKQDSQSMKSAFFQTVEANGTVVALSALYDKDKQRILDLEAQKIGLQLAPSAWQWLLDHHEHNLLAAKNSLLRLSDLIPEQKTIQTEDLISHLQDQSRYSTYDLSDALLAGDLAHAVKIYQYLIATGEPMSLILWTLSKEMRLLMQLFEQPHQATQLGIWRNKVGLYQNALKRFQPQQFLQWPQLLLQMDLAIKGYSHQHAELLMIQIIGELCGKPILK